LTTHRRDGAAPTAGKTGEHPMADPKPNGNQPPPDDALRVVRLRDLIADFEADVEAKHRAKAEGRKLGPSTGHPKLDSKLGEYLVPGLHLIQGAPGAGKSAFALQMGGHCGFPCLYISTEMPLIELLRRTTARETATYLNKLKTGELGARESVRLAMMAAEKCADLAFVDGMNTTITINQLVKYAAALKAAADADNVLIVMDSAQAWIRQRMNSSSREEYSETNFAIGDLLEVASIVKCPVVVISHKNREGNKGNAAAAHSSKGSGNWEYLIESGIDLGLDEDAVKDENGEKTVWASIWKNRNGEPNVKQAMKFHGGFQKFTESNEAWSSSGRNGGGKRKAAGRGHDDPEY
jgi:replicative DNA helicase